MTSATPVRSAADFYEIRKKRRIPKRMRSKLKRSVKRLTIALAILTGQPIEVARLLHKKSWHFNAAQRRQES